MTKLKYVNIVQIFAIQNLKVLLIMELNYLNVNARTAISDIQIN